MPAKPAIVAVATSGCKERCLGTTIVPRPLLFLFQHREAASARSRRPRRQGAFLLNLVQAVVITATPNLWGIAADAVSMGKDTAFHEGFGTCVQAAVGAQHGAPARRLRMLEEFRQGSRHRHSNNALISFHRIHEEPPPAW